MEKITNEILGDAEIYVRKFLEENLPANIVFHTVEHAEYVAEKAEWIGENSGLSPDELNLVRICAWFHDTGYTGGMENHEKRSAQIAGEFLKSHNVEHKTIDLIKKCILSTRIPQRPDDILSEVLCDADMAHLAEEGYLNKIELLRIEKGNLSGSKFSKRQFYKISIDFFRQHRYFTEYAQTKLQPLKEKNFKEMITAIQEINRKKKEKKCKKHTKSKRNSAYSKGVQSMFRNMARMQINLSSIADKKSNILISVNAIVISIAMTVLVKQFEEKPNIIIPTFVFISFSVVTIIFAILATRPHISTGTFSKEDIQKNKVNLLFFGNFYNMELNEYEWAIEKIMKNDKMLYFSMIRDQYSLGKVLAKKYKLLRIAYNVFMIGIIVSVMTFVIAFSYV